MSEQRIDFDSLRRKVFETNRGLLDATFEAYTKKEHHRKEEFVAAWRESFRNVTDSDAQQDGSDGMVLTGIVMTPIMRSDVGSDFAQWVFNNSRAHKLARAVQNICKATGVIPSAYNRRELEKVVAAYRKMKPKGTKPGSFSDRIEAFLLDHDDADFVNDWINQTGDFEYRERRGDIERALGDLKKGAVTVSSISPLQRSSELEEQLEAAVTAEKYTEAATIKTALDALRPAACEEGYFYDRMSEMDEAAAQGDYAKAAEIQQELERIRTRIKAEDEAEARAATIAALETQLDQAVAAKQYAEAARVQTELNQLKVEAEAEVKGEPDAEARAAAISYLDSQLTEAVAAKQYGRAAELQTELDALKGGGTVQPAPAAVVHAPASTQQTTAPVTDVITPPPPSNGDWRQAQTELQERIGSYNGFRVPEARVVLLDQVGRAKTAEDVAAARKRFEDYTH